MDATYSSRVWNIKDGSPLCSPGGDDLPCLLFSSPVRERGGLTGSLLSRGQNGLMTEFSSARLIALTMIKKPPLPYHLSNAEGRRDGFMPSPRVSAQSEMQMVLLRIRTRLTNSIFDDYKRFVKCASFTARPVFIFIPQAKWSLSIYLIVK